MKRINFQVWSYVIFLYSLMMSILSPCLKLLQILVPSLRRQLEGRKSTNLLVKDLAALRANARFSLLYFCSSAGEYEQAKPLIDRFAQEEQIFQHVVFFSQSGIDYIKARGDKVSYSLSVMDSCFTWGPFFACLRPDATIVVRHELWPAFLETARGYGPLFLVDAVVKQYEAQSSWWRKTLRSRLYSLFTKIYAVSESDKTALEGVYHLPPHKILVSGDTKYDRAMERAQAGGASDASQLRDILNRVGSHRFRLVIGSAHKPDVEILIKSRALLKSSIAQSWQLIVVPHDTSPGMLDWVEQRFREVSLSVARFSVLEKELHASSINVVLVDLMGRLAEIYGAADAAFVGGAMHYQVHNVLEPAAYGLAIAHGPFYKNSSEAAALVSLGVSCPCIDPEALSSWWDSLTLAKNKDAHKSLNPALLDLLGAADRIQKDLKLFLLQKRA